MARSGAQFITDKPIDEELYGSFGAYALSVIMSRALPDARDGLKPVHRRILYVMEQMGLAPNKSYVKSARVVGDVMGKYHPHGDTAIYDAMVRLAQDFSTRVLLVDGHGNFGTHEDSPAAMRYCLVGDTRVRLASGASIRIEELSAGLAPNSEADIDVDVLDRLGRPVHASKIFHSGVHPTKRLTTASKNEIRGSYNHPLLCLVPVAGVPTLLWQRLDEITPGTIICLARTKGSARVPNGAEYALGLLAGAWVTEGFASEGRAGFSNTDEAFFGEVVAAYDRVVGGARYVYKRTIEGRLDCHTIDVANTVKFDASPLAELTGHRSHTKFVPDAVWCAGVGAKRAFLMAAFEGDGGFHVGTGDAIQVSYTTYSRRLADEIQQMLLEFGVHASRWDDHRRGGHKLLIDGRANVMAFANNVGFASVKQQALRDVLDRLPALTHRLSSDHVPYLSTFVRSELAGKRSSGSAWAKSNNFDRLDRWAAHRSLILNRIRNVRDVHSVMVPLLDSGYRFVEVTAVIDDEPAPVYSIRVDSQDHSFLAGGFVNHNTEARMSPAAVAMVADLDEETVDMVDNYDGKLKEPKVLPSAIPNLLVNGSTGIAVGMATNMAPHNLAEVVEACKLLLNNPAATDDELFAALPGPDLPTGGLVTNLDGVREAYRTGRGRFVMRARTEITDVSARRRGIIVSELPYMVGAEKIIEEIKKHKENKRLSGVGDVVDLSGRTTGLRLVISCKTGFNPAAVLAELFKSTSLECGFTVHNLALVDGQPQTLTLRQLLGHYLTHRTDVVRRRCAFRRRKAEMSAHLLEGYLVALAAIDEVVALIRASKDTAAARAGLMGAFKLSEVQATAILEMPLRRLTSLEVSKIKEDLAALQAEIAELTRLLTDEAALRALIASELDATVTKFGSPRRTTLLDQVDSAPAAAVLEIPDEPCVVTLSTTGLIGRHSPDASFGSAGKHDGLVARVRTTSRATLGAVTSAGRVCYLQVVELPVAEGKSRGVQVRDFVEMAGEETVVGLFDFGVAPMLALATAGGVVKRVAGADMPKKTGQEIIGLKDGDRLVAAAPLPGGGEDDVELVLVSSGAQLLRFAASSVRPQGRSGGGMAGIRLGDGERVIALGVIAPDSDCVVVTCSDTSAVKSTPAADFPAKGRGTGGVRCQRFNRGEQSLVAAWAGPADAVAAVSGTGAVVKLGSVAGKRDGAGLPVPGVAGLAIRR